MALWAREALECYKQGLMGYSGGTVGVLSAKRGLRHVLSGRKEDCQELGQLGIHVIYQAKKPATFCLRPVSVSEAGFKRNGLLVISRQDGIQTTYHGFRLLLIQVPGEKVQKRSRKYMKKCAVSQGKSMSKFNNRDNAGLKAAVTWVRAIKTNMALCTGTTGKGS